VINAIKFAIEEIEASDQYFDHTRSRPDATALRHAAAGQLCQPIVAVGELNLIIDEDFSDLLERRQSPLYTIVAAFPRRQHAAVLQDAARVGILPAYATVDAKANSPKAGAIDKGDKVAFRDSYQGWWFVMHAKDGTVDYGWAPQDVLSNCSRQEGTP
jgi:hypothetical protein